MGIVLDVYLEEANERMGGGREREREREGEREREREKEREVEALREEQDRGRGRRRGAGRVCGRECEWEGGVLRGGGSEGGGGRGGGGSPGWLGGGEPEIRLVGLEPPLLARRAWRDDKPPSLPPMIPQS